MVKTTTVESFQAADRERDTNAAIRAFNRGDDEIDQDWESEPKLETVPEPSSNYLADLAQRMANDASRNGHEDAGDPFEGMALEIETDEAYGLIQSKVRAWLDERGIIAQEDEIRAKTNDLYGAAAGHAQPARPTASATYTVGPDGLVNGFTPDAPRPELPGMPARPAAVSGDVLTPLKVPSDAIFDDSEYAMSSPLSQRARTLISRHPEHLKHLEAFSVIYLWRKAGGKSKGRVVFGKCQKPSGLLKHFSEATYVIWLAADHCRAAGFDDRQIEALLFHEMLHTGVAEVDENTGRGGGAITVPHELEVFRAEIEIYGLWAPDLKAIAPAFKQASLFGGPTPTECRGCRMEVKLDADGWCALCSPPMPAAAPMFSGQPSDFERQEAAGAAYSDEIDDGAPPLNLSGAGVLIHPDGTPMTAEEIAEQEAAELRDDPAEDDFDDDEEYDDSDEDARP